MAIKPVRTELFRFVSQRPVQLIDQEKKSLVFVSHPNPSASQFLKDLDEENISIARNQIQANAKKFKALTTARALPGQYEALQKFSLWLSRNKRQLSASRLVDHASHITPLNEADELYLWDQLFYQLVMKKNPTLRQACSNLLIANHFIRITKDQTVEDLARAFYEGNPNLISSDDYKRKFVKRLANAKILVPKVFSVTKSPWKKEELQKPVPNDNQLHKLPVSELNHSRELLTLGNKNARSRARYQTLGHVKENLKKNFTRRGARNKSIEEILKDPELQLDARTRTQLEKHPDKSVNIFTYYKDINHDMVDENRTLRETTDKMLDTPGDSIADYCYLIQLDFETKSDTLTFSVKVPKRSIQVSKADLTIYKGSQKVGSTQTLLLLESDSLIKTYDVLPDQHFNVDESATFSIKGSVILSDGHSIDINVTISAKDNTYYSCATTPDTPDEVDSPELYGVNRIGMGIFRRVEQEVCCYVPGEVSHIENIMAREYKERSTRHFTSTEDTVETSADTEVETNTDTSTTVRNEVQKAVSEVMSNANQLSAGASTGATGKTPYGDFSADASLGFAMTNAAANSDMEATTYAQDITSAAAERVLQKTSEKRTSKIVKEFEEKIRHGYDNREGDEHVTGIYRWIDIIYTNRLVNYGNMEMVEFLIPEPSRFYKDTILGLNKPKKPNNQGGDDEAEKLKSLDDLGIKSPEDIKAYHHENIGIAAGNTVGNYFQELANYYGIVLDGPKEYDKKQTIPLVAAGLDHKKPHTKPNSVMIETGYELTRMQFSGHFVHNPGGDNNPTMFSISAAGEQWEKRLSEKNQNKDKFTYNIPSYTKEQQEEQQEFYDEHNLNMSAPDITIFDFSDSITGMVDASLTAHRTISYNVNIELTVVIAPEVLLEWKTDTFKALSDAYKAYLDGEAQNAAEEDKKKDEELAKLATGNTALNRRVEIRELKRAAIEMITRPFGFYIGGKFLGTGKCRVNFPKQSKEWEVYSSHVKFFEQAFEWDIMAYIFYPYYWADRCDWRKLLKAEDPIDQIFESFLQSGMARMVVPVRRGFENAVNYYFETGEIWNGGDLVLDTDDELYLSIDDELEEPESFVEDEWQTRVPTTLTLIQGDSAFLKGEGLPCCDKVTGEDETGIDGSKALLGVMKEG